MILKEQIQQSWQSTKKDFVQMHESNPYFRNLEYDGGIIIAACAGMIAKLILTKNVHWEWYIPMLGSGYATVFRAAQAQGFENAKLRQTFGEFKFFMNGDLTDAERIGFLHGMQLLADQSEATGISMLDIVGQINFDHDDDNSPQVVATDDLRLAVNRLNQAERQGFYRGLKQLVHIAKDQQVPLKDIFAKIDVVKPQIIIRQRPITLETDQSEFFDANDQQEKRLIDKS